MLEDQNPRWGKSQSSSLTSSVWFYGQC